MKIHDEAEWKDYLGSLVPLGDLGKSFEEFLVSWAESAEALIGEGLSVIQAVRSGLGSASAPEPAAAVEMIGPALLMLGTHWEPIREDIDRFFESMTTLEQVLYHKCAGDWLETRARFQQEVLQSIQEKEKEDDGD